jgi:regulator of replication initiation timing
MVNKIMKWTMETKTISVAEYNQLLAENKNLKESNSAWIMAHNDLALELSKLVTENETLKLQLTKIRETLSHENLFW